MSLNQVASKVQDTGFGRIYVSALLSRHRASASASLTAADFYVLCCPAVPKKLIRGEALYVVHLLSTHFHTGAAAAAAAAGAATCVLLCCAARSSH
jgi:hypothetical protein